MTQGSSSDDWSWSSHRQQSLVESGQGEASSSASKHWTLVDGGWVQLDSTSTTDSSGSSDVTYSDSFDLEEHLDTTYSGGGGKGDRRDY